MRWMLISGGGLLLMIIAGVGVAMLGSKAPQEGGGISMAKDPAPAAMGQALVERSEAAVLAEAEPLARKFLEATTVDEILPTVRNPEFAEIRLREYYPGGTIPAPGLSQFNPTDGIATKGKLVSIPVLTRDHEERVLGFVETPQGLKVDWESWVGWSQIPWREFISSKTVIPHVFRVTLSPVDYYNFGFADESKWQSYRLESPDKEYSIYGYAGQGTALAQQLHLDADQKNILLTLVLKFPPNAKSDSQVEIERLVCEGWIENGGTP